MSSPQISGRVIFRFRFFFEERWCSVTSLLGPVCWQRLEMTKQRLRENVDCILRTGLLAVGVLPGTSIVFKKWIVSRFFPKCLQSIDQIIDPSEISIDRVAPDLP